MHSLSTHVVYPTHYSVADVFVKSRYRIQGQQDIFAMICC